MLKLKIVSPERIVYDGEVNSLKVPGTQGSFEILDNHAPIISALSEGIIEYSTAQGKQSLNVLSGFVEVKKNQISLCVEVSSQR